MVKENRGTKRLCESCDARFYDLDLTPIVCPLCDTPFKEEKPKLRPVPRHRPKPKVEVTEPAPAAAPEPNPEFVSVENSAEAGENENEDEAKLADLGDDEVEIPPEENGDVLIDEDEGETGSDVSGIVAPPAEPKDDR